jgi:hypothetical protein
VGLHLPQLKPGQLLGGFRKVGQIRKAAAHEFEFFHVGEYIGTLINYQCILILGWSTPMAESLMLCAFVNVRSAMVNSLAPAAKPRYDTMLKLLHALGVKLSASPVHS